MSGEIVAIKQLVREAGVPRREVDLARRRPVPSISSVLSFRIRGLRHVEEDYSNSNCRRKRLLAL